MEKDEIINYLEKECLRWEIRAGIAIGLASKYGGVGALKEYLDLLDDLKKPPKELE